MTAIPYQPQLTPDGCGEAALCMAYRSLGIACTPEALRPAVSRPGRGRANRTWTRLLARDALGRGLHALILELTEPHALLRLQGDDLRLILNHRLDVGSAAGHYSVFVRGDADGVELHDPRHGPNRRLTWAALDLLWRPGRPAEITGLVLVAFAAQPAAHRCYVCGTDVPPTLKCPWCLKELALQPAAALGCTRPGCAGRSCRRGFCPWCDLALLEP